MTQEAAIHDTGYAPERWAFDDEVTRVFDDMLTRSIPDYHTMRRTVFSLGRQFVQGAAPGTAIVDLGSSRGEGLAPFVEAFGDTLRYVGVEVSAPMVTAFRQRFASLIAKQIVEIHKHDLREQYPQVRNVALTMATLTMMFVPIELRQRLVQRIYDSTAKGGAFIMVEKVLGGSPRLQDMLVDEYHRFKANSGYSQDEIERKRLSLQGVLVPQTVEANERMLSAAGFGQVECVWRALNFAAWLAIR